MKPTEKKKVADALVERSEWTHIGLLPIHLRPLTLGQIYETGEFACQLEADGLDMHKNIVATAEMLLRYKSSVQLQEIFLVCAFRRKWMRRVFRRYILRRLTVSRFQKALSVCIDAFSANFFLTSIIFLHQANQITEPKTTTPLGQ